MAQTHTYRLSSPGRGNRKRKQPKAIGSIYQSQIDPLFRPASSDSLTQTTIFDKDSTTRTEQRPHDRAE